MFGITKRKCTVAAAIFLGAISTSYAAPVKYDFSVNWNSGELAGSVSNGWFTFDSALALPNAQHFSQHTLLDFGFSMRNSFYGVSDVQTGSLTFDHNGALRIMSVGTDCGPGFCRSNPGNTNSFYVVFDSQSRLDRFYGVAGDSGYATSYGPGAAQVSTVPEPETLLLLLAGLGVMGIARRKRG